MNLSFNPSSHYRTTLLTFKTNHNCCCITLFRHRICNCAAFIYLFKIQVNVYLCLPKWHHCSLWLHSVSWSTAGTVAAAEQLWHEKWWYEGRRVFVLSKAASLLDVKTYFAVEVLMNDHPLLTVNPLIRFIINSLDRELHVLQRITRLNTHVCNAFCWTFIFWTSTNCTARGKIFLLIWYENNFRLALSQQCYFLCEMMIK